LAAVRLLSPQARSRAPRRRAGPVSVVGLDSQLRLASPLPCEANTPAVIIDLDEGPTVFRPGARAQPAWGLPKGLARLCEAGVTELWISGIDANLAPEVRELLRTSGWTRLATIHSSLCAIPLNANKPCLGRPISRCASSQSPEISEVTSTNCSITCAFQRAKPGLMP
jgi:hypothetical protein